MAFAQDSGAVKGTVYDAELGSEALMFAQVSLKDSPWSTQTNLHGNFEIAGISAGSYVMEIQYPGYESQVFPLRIDHNAVTFIEKGLHTRKMAATSPDESLGELASLPDSER